MGCIVLICQTIKVAGVLQSPIAGDRVCGRVRPAVACRLSGDRCPPQ